MTCPIPSESDISSQALGGKKRSKIPHWRITWLGICLSIMLWFGPGAYFKKIQQYSEIEYQSGSISESDHNATIHLNARYVVACKLTACVLFLGSAIFFISQMEIHRRSPNQ